MSSRTRARKHTHREGSGVGYRQTGRQESYENRTDKTDRQAGRQAGRQAERQTGRQTDRQAGRPLNTRSRSRRTGCVGRSDTGIVGRRSGGGSVVLGLSRQHCDKPSYLFVSIILTFMHHQRTLQRAAQQQRAEPCRVHHFRLLWMWVWIVYILIYYYNIIDYFVSNQADAISTSGDRCAKDVLTVTVLVRSRGVKKSSESLSSSSSSWTVAIVTGTFREKNSK